MRRYSMFAAWFLSFFSGDLYRDVAHQWRGVGFWYLVVLLGLSWVPWTIQTDRKIKNVVARELPKFSKQIPPMAFQDGKLSVDAEQPYYIKDPDDQKVLAILDTTGEITSLDGQDADLLITQDKFVFRDANKGRIQEQDMSQFGINMNLDGPKIEAFGKKFSGVVAPVMFPIAWLFSFAYRWIQALIYGAVGLVMASMFGARITYAGSVRMAAVAATPVIAANTILELVPNFSIPGLIWNPIALAIPLGFLALGVKSNAGMHEPSEFEQQPPLPPGAGEEARYVER